MLCTLLAMGAVPHYTTTVYDALQFGSDDSCLIYNDILIVAPTYKIGDPQARLEQPLGSPANDACTLKCPAGMLLTITLQPHGALHAACTRLHSRAMISVRRMHFSMQA